jgi:hypothetical protein
MADIYEQYSENEDGEFEEFLIHEDPHKVLSQIIEKSNLFIDKMKSEINGQFNNNGKFRIINENTFQYYLHLDWMLSISISQGIFV